MKLLLTARKTRKTLRDLMQLPEGLIALPPRQLWRRGRGNWAPNAEGGRCSPHPGLVLFSSRPYIKSYYW